MKTLFTALWLAAAVPALAESPAVLSLSAQQAAAFGIETVAVQPVDAAVSKAFPAKVAVPNAQLRVVGAPLDGVVEAVLVAEGETVAAGQVLARIRSARLLELQAAYLETRTRRLLSGETVSRDRKLRAEGIVAERRLLESEAAHRELLNTEARDHQALRLAGMPDSAIDELARGQQLGAVLEVRAPLNGVVLEQLATAGQRLAAADPLYRIGDLSTLWVEVHVPLESLGAAAPGTAVELPQQGIDARVITVGRMVHGTDQGVLVRAAVSDGAERLRPGQFVEARLRQGTGGDAVHVPAAAVVRRGHEDYVFLRHPDGFIAAVVEVLAREGERVVVRAELPPDAAVAARGTAALKAVWTGGGE
jgi:RND family efflux transporter MFP subunit